MAAEPLTIAVSRTPLSLPLFVARQEGYFAAEGVTVKLDEVLGGHRAMARVNRGAADLATVSETVVVFNSFERSDFVLIASLVSSTDDVKLIAADHAPVQEIEDLAGRRVGAVLGSASHYYLDTALLLAGVDPEAVHTAGVQPESAAAALAEGRIDAAAVWEPFAFDILHSTPGTRIIPAPPFYVLSFNLVADQALLTHRAESLIDRYPGRAQAILRETLDTPPAFVEWIWPRYEYRLTLRRSLVNTLESEARWARANNHVKAAASPNYLDFIHSGLLRRVRPAEVTILE